MKQNKTLILWMATSLWQCAFAQGTFIYDQQSSDEFNVEPGGAYVHGSSGPGQSFVPTLTPIGFVRLVINDNNPQDALGTTLFVNLRSGSINGPIFATSALVSIANGIAAPVNFFFPTNTPVTPGTPYYFDVMRQGGVDSWTANISFYNYGNGTLFLLGAPDLSDRDMWFRSGLYVPEPSALMLVGLAVLCFIAKHKSNCRLAKR